MNKIADAHDVGAPDVCPQPDAQNTGTAAEIMVRLRNPQTIVIDCDPNEHGFASDLDAACAVRDVLGRC